MIDTRNLVLERSNTGRTRVLGVVLTGIPALLGLVLLYRGGVLGWVGGGVLLLAAAVNLRMALRFHDQVRVQGSLLTLRRLWTRAVSTYQCHNVVEVFCRLALEGSQQLHTLSYQIDFEDGGRLFLGSDFQNAAQGVELILQDAAFPAHFPLRVESFVLQHWTRYPGVPALGVGASYRHADGTLATIHVYGEDSDNISEGVEGARVQQEFEQVLCHVGKVEGQQGTEVKQVSRTVQEGPGETQFLSACFEFRTGPNLTTSQAYLTGHRGRFFKVRVTTLGDAARAHRAFFVVVDSLLALQGYPSS